MITFVSEGQSSGSSSENYLWISNRTFKFVIRILIAPRLSCYIYQGRPGGIVVYQYTRKKFAKIPQNTPNSSKCTKNYTQVYFIPEIQRKWYTEYPYLSYNVPYTRFKKPLYTVYPKTLAYPDLS